MFRSLLRFIVLLGTAWLKRKGITTSLALVGAAPDARLIQTGNRQATDTLYPPTLMGDIVPSRRHDRRLTFTAASHTCGNAEGGRSAQLDASWLHLSRCGWINHEC